MEGMRAPKSGTLILVADESRHSRGLLAFLLRANGFQVVEAMNGREALDIILNRKPALVLLEAFLPGKTGFEICSFLKYNPATRHTPVIMTTSSVESQGRDEDWLRRKCNADDCLTKPFTLRELLDRIEKVMDVPTTEPA